MRRILLLFAIGAFVTALTATAAFAQQDTATLSFEVDTEGQVPEGTSFLGFYGPPDSQFSSVQLTDPDRDGTYTGVAGGIEGTELDTGEYMVRIGQNNQGQQGTVTLYATETITLDEDTTISTSVDFGSDEPSEGPSQEQPQCFLPEGCFLSGDGSPQEIFGGIGPDYIVGGGGDDALYGLGNDDWLDGGSGDDLVLGDDGDDLVDGGSDNDLVRGDNGDDYVTGFTGNDTLEAGSGNDYIYAADGEFDRVSGGPGYDVCVVDTGDFVSGCEEAYTG